MLKGKKILLGISGSIAAYKTPHLVRLLTKQGAEVRVVMTPAATQFVSPLALATVSKQPVLIALAENDQWANHVQLGRWADYMIMAPLSCNTLAKMAQGICDNLLMAVYLSATCPVVVAPAMDEDMWLHPSTSRNLQILESYGNQIIPVEHGELASGLIGAGRMAEPEKILEWIDQKLNQQQFLFGKKVLITAGPTHEPLDPVRFIGNRSSGKMGIALAKACEVLGAEVTLVLGPSTEKAPSGAIKVIPVQTAKEMLDACMDIFPKSDIAIMAAAVADYTPEHPSGQKIKKTDTDLSLKLIRTPDILQTLGKMKKENQCLVGFALETEKEREHALDKLVRKNADFIVLNSMNEPGAGFGIDTNKISIFDRYKNEWHFETKSKQEVAHDILQVVYASKH
jgi:phosphopantothenoylcysteine decarboxylase/phosphopantothenate--cysteine ligase